MKLINNNILWIVLLLLKKKKLRVIDCIVDKFSLCSTQELFTFSLFLLFSDFSSSFTDFQYISKACKLSWRGFSLGVSGNSGISSESSIKKNNHSICSIQRSTLHISDYQKIVYFGFKKLKYLTDIKSLGFSLHICNYVL